MGIFPILNLSDLYPYRRNVVEAPNKIHEQTTKWRQQIPTVKPIKIDKILDKRATKRTRNNEYFEYLVKWQGCMVEDSTWITEQELQLQGFDLVDIEDNSFVL